MLRKWDDLPEFMRTPEVRPYWEILNKKKGQLLLKRIFDLIFSLIFLIILAIPMVIIAILIIHKPMHKVIPPHLIHMLSKMLTPQTMKNTCVCLA